MCSRKRRIDAGSVTAETMRSVPPQCLQQVSTSNTRFFRTAQEILLARWVGLSAFDGSPYSCGVVALGGGGGTTSGRALAWGANTPKYEASLLPLLAHLAQNTPCRDYALRVDALS